MSDHRSTLERELERLSPPRIPFDQLERRRDKKRRDQRIRAGALGAALALAVVLAGARALLTGPVPGDRPSPAPAPPPVERVGFIGVPPEGAEPSTPVTGDLVLRLDTTVSYGGSFKTTMYVFADGRMIWERHGAPTGVPEGARANQTGYLEQVLTPEGVQALRTEILGTGLFGNDLHLKGEFDDAVDFYGLLIQVLGDDGMVTLAWARGNPDERRPTRAERDTIARLVERLEDPGAWLPETAWQDRVIRAYVASNYGIGFSLVTKPDGDCCLRPDPAELPPPADTLLGTQFNQCVTTDEAKAIAGGFEAAGMTPIGQSNPPGGYEYETGTEPDVNGITQTMVLYPYLPHWSC
jgi:hypothetical protein